MFCPECEMKVFVSLGDAGYFSAVGGWEPGDPVGSPLRAAAPADLEGLRACSTTRLSRPGRTASRSLSPICSAGGTSGECGAEFSIAEQVTEQ